MPDNQQLFFTNGVQLLVGAYMLKLIADVGIEWAKQRFVRAPEVASETEKKSREAAAAAEKQNRETLAEEVREVRDGVHDIQLTLKNVATKDDLAEVRSELRSVSERVASGDSKVAKVEERVNGVAAAHGKKLDELTILVTQHGVFIEQFNQSNILPFKKRKPR